LRSNSNTRVFARVGIVIANKECDAKSSFSRKSGQIFERQEQGSLKKEEENEIRVF